LRKTARMCAIAIDDGHFQIAVEWRSRSKRSGLALWIADTSKRVGGRTRCRKRAARSRR
jgi:hypothetical protein